MIDTKLILSQTAAVDLSDSGTWMNFVSPEALEQQYVRQAAVWLHRKCQAQRVCTAADWQVRSTIQVCSTEGCQQWAVSLYDCSV